MPHDRTIQRVGIHEWGTHPVPPAHLRDLLREMDGLDCEFAVCDTDDVADFDGVVTLFHHDEFVGAVEWVHNIRSGYDDFPLDDYREAGVTMTNSTGVAGDLVAETVTGLVLTLAKGLHRFRDRQNDGEWERLPWQRPFEISGANACVVGLGELGGSVATRLGVLGMNVEGVDIRPVSGLGLDRVHDVSRIEDAVADARFVVLTTPLTDATRGLVDGDVLDAMREDAYLVNVSRGPIVEQHALVDALENDDIAGAALDVFDPEPLPRDSPLWEMDEVVVTPHAAAQANTYGDRIADLVETNIGRLNDGATPWNEIV
ncbi:D-2-hydroxyacid dehydrogenase [Halobellus sp. Atlit-38R]|uniref:D-2-hydroxyacid dehydrogenase n=1 Tax=Halobellus sp. Atlit-38R TaxID=2282131 RepID=UPI000EF287D4|nr:D-2-hydroxyacid dehydrogenase [Halobellus sp. Atlit-38R]RLM88387.1 D-2-hydroxyacid dehydrogenase [Halobellus sp. Atlit-38R]